MARKNPYDPEEGIIDLFEIVDEPSPEGDEQTDKPGGDDARSGEPETSSEEAPEQASEELVSSRYPFENSEEFFEGSEPPPETAQTAADLPEQQPSAPPSVAEKDVSENAEEALIRVFEEEMARAGAGGAVECGETEVHEAQDVAEAQDAESDAPVEAPAEAVPLTDDVLVVGVAGDGEAGDEEERETGEAAVPAGELTEDAPAVAEEGPGRTEESEAAAAHDGAADEGSLSVLNMFEEAEKSVADNLPDARSEASCREPAFPSTEGPVYHGLGGCLTEAGTPGGDAVEERFIRLEEALGRLNERVADLERRVEDSEEQVPALSALSGDIRSLLTEGTALCGQLKALSMPSEPASDPVPASEPVFTPEESVEPADVVGAVEEASAPEVSASPEEEEPDVFGLAFESLEQRVSVLEQRPVPVSDTAGIAQDVLALVRVDMEKNLEEQDAVARVVAQLQHRVEDLEARPLPQLILPELPDAEAITADVMGRIQGEVDRVAAEAAARVLREEIASMLQK